jgi:hypothetical protein
MWCMLICIIIISEKLKMGNLPQQQQQQQRVQPKRISKTQVEIACLKVKAHLELVKDRKSNEVMKA